MRLLFSLIIVLAGALSGRGTDPRTLSGSVAAPDGTPLAGAMVKLVEGSRTRSFARSSASGHWTLRIPALSDTAEAIISVEHLSYAPLTLPLPEADAPLHLTMTEGRTLREVTVTAPSLTVRGDTLSFNLASFMSQGDVSLEDALRKVPGINVASNGSISYLGKDISNFYIEGLDMLGGRYSLATRNLPAEYVGSVEVLSNHQDLKKDKGKLSDKVALNIRLKSKVRFRPVGTAEAAAGYGNGSALYYAGATGMMFTPTFQTLLTAKYGNISEISRYENATHVVGYGDMDSSPSPAEKAIGSLTGDTPPLSSHRYLNPRDLNTSVNAVRKISEDVSITANAGYSFTRSDYGYSSSATYFTGATPITIVQEMTPRASLHKPSLSIDYKLNSPTVYRRNRLSAEAEITDRDITTLLPESALLQRRKAHTVRITDVFTNTIRTSSREWHLSTGVSYSTTPSAKVNATGSADTDFLQSAESRTFTVQQTAHTSFIRRRTEYYLPLEVNYTYSDLSTALTSAILPEEVSPASNRAFYHNLKAGITPSAEHKSADSRYSLRVTLPVTLNLISGHNAITANSFRSLRPYFNPNLSFIFNVTPKSSFTLNASVGHSAGDPLDLLDNPVQTGWRSLRARSGLIARSTNRTAMLRYDFKLPFDYLFFNAAVGYTSLSSNLMTDQTVTPAYNYLTTILSPSSSRTLTGNFRISKTLSALSTKLTLGGNISRSSSRMIQQQLPVSYHTLLWSVTPSIMCHTWRPLEANLSASYSASRSSYLGSANTVHTVDARGTLTFYLTPRLHFIPAADYTRRTLPDGTAKQMTLFDTALRLKLKKIALTLSLDNILNTRSYTYTLFSGLDTYTYSYRLRGRTLTLSLRLTN